MPDTQNASCGARFCTADAEIGPHSHGDGIITPKRRTEHLLRTHDCADRYCAARTVIGDIRLNGGGGLLVASADHTDDDVREWFRMSKPGPYREQYRAVLRFLEREAGGRGDPPIHTDEALAALERVRSVCMNTDGDYLDGDAEIPVGEVLRMIAGA